MKILITGGHMAPALALIQALPKTTEIVYVGRKHSFEGDSGVSLEYTTLQRLHIPFIPLTTGRLQRVMTPYTLTSLLKMPRGLWEAYRILAKERPDVVVGFGGYLSVPIGVVASLLRIPFVIHEQTMKRGLANKFLTKFATAICISWESSAAYFPKEKTILTGNPLLSYPQGNISHLLPISKEELPLIVITGGSAGSHAINMLFKEALPQLLKHFRIVHQTGDAKEFADFDHLLEKKQSLSEKMQDRYHVVKFVSPEEIESLYKAADLVVSRGGINTVETLLLLDKPSLIIPLPSGQQHEQQTNAQFLEKTGLGVMMEQHLLSPHSLYATIAAMVENKEKYKNKEKASLKQLHERAAKKLVEVLKRCIPRQYGKERFALS